MALKSSMPQSISVTEGLNTDKATKCWKYDLHNFGYLEMPGLADHNDGTHSKTISDPVHGHITLHPLLVAIIDTPQFQRLRHIKQCGLVEYVYPGATHNRFSHSIGVAHLAGRFLRCLRDRQPHLGITEQDLLCVEIAGLCHDLGHGPFSHTWELFINKKNSGRENHKHWKHEVVTINMLEYLIEVNNLRAVFSKWNISRDRIHMIKDIILGRKNTNVDHGQDYLYQIVNNNASGLDVDKWDYFLRDSHYLGLPCRLDCERLMLLAKVIQVNGSTQICFRDKELSSIYEMFRIRSELHRLAYQHRVSKLMEALLVDMLIQVDGKINSVTGETTNFYKCSMAAALDLENESPEGLVLRMAHFSTLTDDMVLCAIKQCPTDSQTILSPKAGLDLFERRPDFKKAFQLVGDMLIPHDYKSEDGIKEDLISFLKSHESSHLVNPENILIQVVVLHWGQGIDDPTKGIYFYSKANPEQAKCLSSPEMTDYLICQTNFQQTYLRIFGLHLSADGMQALKQCFQLLCKNIINST